MHIKHIEISNFRKLRAVRIDLAEDKTVFVGANNSGKTSAMVALRKFLVETSDFAYQQPRMVSLKGAPLAEALANTFEDALVYENLDLFETLKGLGLIAKFRDAIAATEDLPALAVAVQKFLDKGKAEFALNLLYATHRKTVVGIEVDNDVIDDLVVPTYIHDGLLWLSDELKRRELELPVKAAA